MATSACAEAGQDKSQEVSLGILHGWQGPKYFCHLSLLFLGHKQEAGLEVEWWDLNQHPYGVPVLQALALPIMPQCVPVCLLLYWIERVCSHKLVIPQMPATEVAGLEESLEPKNQFGVLHEDGGNTTIYHCCLPGPPTTGS